MDVFAAIWHASMDQLSTIGVMFVFCGIFFRLIPKSGHFQWCVEVRKAMIKEAELNGDSSKVVKLKNEINAIENKLPLYGKILAGLGVLLFIASYLLNP